MRVVLITHTKDPVRLCVAAAKLCHEPDESDFVEMMSGLSDKHMERVLTHVIKLGHESTIEHASFTFYIEGVSRALTHQLVRHRMASYSQQSQRYVNLDQFEYIVPERLKGKPEEELYHDTMKDLAGKYKELRKAIPLEDARNVLPNACTTKIVVTMNARELRHFFKLRCDKTAQIEIRTMAKEMLKQAREVAPLLFHDLQFDE